jgi:hypothetical protein
MLCEIDGEIDGPLGLSLLVYYTAEVDPEDASIVGLELTAYADIAVNSTDSVYPILDTDELRTLVVPAFAPDVPPNLYDQLEHAVRKHLRNRIDDGEFSVDRPR